MFSFSLQLKVLSEYYIRSHKLEAEIKIVYLYKIIFDRIKFTLRRTLKIYKLKGCKYQFTESAELLHSPRHIFIKTVGMINNLCSTIICKL